MQQSPYKRRNREKQEAIRTETYDEMFQEQLPLIRKAQKGDAVALAKLEIMSRSLRRSKAQKFLPNRPDLYEDAMQAGWTGILNALKKWDAKWGRLFLAYAHWDISEAIRSFKYEMELTVARPIHMHRKLAKLSKFHTYDTNELESLSGMSGRAINGIMAMRQGDVSLQEIQFEGDEDLGARISALQTNQEDSPLFAVDQAEILKMLEGAIAQLDPKEAYVVKLYYENDTTFSEIAETMNLTRQRVEQINTMALNHIRKMLSQKLPELKKAIKPRFRARLSTPALVEA